MIDALFGSKTRVKLLHLFMNNPGKAFYVREITRLIDEQINSVRRELANMLGVGVITSNNSDHKLYYEVNQRYEFYGAFREIFAGVGTTSGEKTRAKKPVAKQGEWQQVLGTIPGVRVVVAAGVLVEGSAAKVDLLIAGNIPRKRLDDAVASIETSVGRTITYSMMTYDEFYYRMSVRDRFLYDILANKHDVLVDSDNIIE